MKLSDKDLFQQIQDLFIKNVDTFWDYGINLLNAVMPIFEICFGIYLLLWVLNYWANPSFTRMGIDFIKKCIAWSIVIALAFNAGNYKSVATTVYQFGDELSTTLISGNNQKKTNNIMDEIRNEVNNSIEKAYDAGDEAFSGLTNSGKHLTFNMSVWVSDMILTAMIAIIFAVQLAVKVCILLSLIVAPFFVGCLLFDSTRNWGMSWINTTFSFILTLVFYASIVTIMSSIFNNHIKDIITSALTPEPDKSLMGSVLALPPIMLIMAIVFLYILNNIPQIAGAITGGNTGFGSGAGTATAFGAGRMVGKAFNRKRKDPPPPPPKPENNSISGS
ncbi:MAG: type IV secretion system protein [Neisseriaceae bacterium]|nr:type IV secretion system protein [Neisseriaceae bacterium]